MFLRFLSASTMWLLKISRIDSCFVCAKLRSCGLRTTVLSTSLCSFSSMAFMNTYCCRKKKIVINFFIFPPFLIDFFFLFTKTRAEPGAGITFFTGLCLSNAIEQGPCLYKVRLKFHWFACWRIVIVWNRYFFS